MRAVVLTVALLLSTVSAHAQSLTLSGVARTYCEAIIAGDLSAVISLLTDSLREEVDARGGVPLLWQGTADLVASCMPVGNSGTRDRPETILALGFEGGKPSSSLTIVMVFVDERLRIDDVKFADGTTLRERLTVRV